MHAHAPRTKRSRLWLPVLMLLSQSLSPALRAAARSAETDFLDIPVGGRPAALGGAYSALADDAYAPSLNPGGLGFLGSIELSGQHLAYLEGIQYEYLSAGVPLPRRAGGARSGLGASVQYLNNGDIQDTEGGAPDFSSRFAAYNLSYGRSLTRRLSLGVTGKIVSAKIADVAARAYAADVGVMYKPGPKTSLAAVLGNVGAPLKFEEEGNPLPTAFHLGAAYRPTAMWTASAEGVFRKSGGGSAHLGLEFRPIPITALRASYRTDGAGQGPLGGFTAGMGLLLRGGNEFSYAWVPLGDLGEVHYFSFNLKFKGPADKTRSQKSWVH